MKKILFITAFTPSQFSAGQNYTKNLLNDIGLSYKVDLVYFKYNSQEYTPPHLNIKIAKAIRLSLVDKLVNFFIFPFFHPIFSGRFSFKTLFFIRDIIKKNTYDLIYFDFSQVFIYNLFIRHHNKVLMAHDVMYQKFSRQGLPIERFWIGLNEKILLNRKHTKILVFSKKDRAIINSKYKREAGVVNFYISPQIIKLNTEQLPLEDYFCFFAAWNRAENYEGLEWFIKNVIIHTRSLQFNIIGINLSDHLLKMISKLENVKYLGFIEDPYKYIAEAKALIAPIFKGAGVKVKVIESLACGTPVIGTSVALEGMDSTFDKGLIECNTADEFKEAILGYTISPDRKMILRQLFLDNYVQNGKETFSQLI